MRSRLGIEWSVGGDEEGSSRGEEKGESEDRRRRVNVSSSEAAAVNREHTKQEKEVFHPHAVRREGIVKVRAEERHDESSGGDNKGGMGGESEEEGSE